MNHKMPIALFYAEGMVLSLLAGCAANEAGPADTATISDTAVFWPPAGGSGLPWRVG